MIFKKPFFHENRLFFSLNDGEHGQEPWVLLFNDSLTLGAVLLDEKDFSMKIWPNPAQDRVSISADFFDGKSVAIHVLDAAGRVVFSEKASPAQDETVEIRLPENLATGTYFVVVQSVAKKLNVIHR